jgi:hypothetical protein
MRKAAAMAVAWTLMSAAAAGAGQDPVPPGTITFGPVQIRPSMVLKDMGFDENVFNTPDDPKRDFTFTLAPGAEVRFRMRRLALSYVSTTEYVYYRTFKSERGTNTSSGLRMDLDLGRLKPYGTISGLDSKARLNSPRARAIAISTTAPASPSRSGRARTCSSMGRRAPSRSPRMRKTSAASI